MRSENQPDRELTFSGLTVLSVAMGPISFLTLQNRGVEMWISFSLFFGFCILGFYFQTLRRKETRRLRMAMGTKKFVYQIGDEVQYMGSGFVVLKHGFNHYYLRELKSDQIILVKRARVDLAPTTMASVRPAQQSAQQMSQQASKAL